MAFPSWLNRLTGRQKTESLPYPQAVARGEVSGGSVFTSNGVQITAGAVTNYPVCPAALITGGKINVPPDAGVQLSFVSTSAQDGVGGTGIRTLALGYLDVNLAAQTESITLNGLTPVLTVATGIRWVQTLTVITAGTTQAAVGAITCASGGVTYGTILAGEEVQESSYRRIPAGKVFYPDEIIASSLAATADTSSLMRLEFKTGTLFVPSTAVGLQNGTVVINLTAGRGIPAGAIMGVIHTTNKAATVTASIIGRLENA